MRRLLWPLAILAALILLNVAFSPGFLSIQMREGHLYGSLIDILRFGAPLILVSLGMTLVIATGGIDLSVGSIVAISGALACLQISQDQGLFAAVALALGLCTLLGAWNGFLVAAVGIQPIIATLILQPGDVQAGQGAGHGHHRADRQVDAAGRDHQGHADRDQDQRGAEPQDVDQAAVQVALAQFDREEVGGEDQIAEQQYDQRQRGPEQPMLDEVGHG